MIAGAYDVVVAAGVEVMTRTPMGASGVGGEPFGPLAKARYADVEIHGTRGLIHQGLSAELIADRWGLTRADLDAFGLRSRSSPRRHGTPGASTARSSPSRPGPGIPSPRT